MLKHLTAHHHTDATNSTAEVAAGVQIIELLIAQLLSVEKDVETSVNEVCRSFSSMSARAQESVTASTTLLGDNHSGTGSEGLVSAVGQTLEDLLRNIRSTCDFSRDIRTRIRELDARVQSVADSLTQVEGISEKAKLVALNGQIEAARLGQNGAAFGVVAHETKSLASNAAKSSVTIRQLVTELGTAMRDASHQMQVRTDSDALMAEKSELTVHEMLEYLRKTHEQFEDSIRTSTQLSRQLTADIAQAVTAMQFQDRVNQRIDHVVESLQELAARLQPIAQSADTTRVRILVNQWNHSLSHKYTMDAERHVSDSAAHSHATQPVSTVELF